MEYASLGASRAALHLDLFEQPDPRRMFRQRAPARGISPTHPEGCMHPAIEYIQERRSAFVEELKGFLRIPCVSTKSEHRGDMLKAAGWLVEQMRGVGLEHVEILPTAGHPVVYADWLHAPGKPTALIYGHYDVQPAEPLELWTTGAFEPTVRNGELYARGAVDDKGQVFMHLKALEAHLKTNGRLPVNVRLLIEGEEEIGSPNLGAFIKERLALLEADVVVISDTAMIGKEAPGITVGLRGLVYFQIDVEGAKRDLHSGGFGGAVENPAFALAQLLTQLKDRNGRITIPGFYDDVRRLPPDERRALAKLPFRDRIFQKDLGVPALFGEKGFTTLERLWARPTLEVNGLYSGFIGDGAKTVLPGRAMAKVSMRLVPNQDPNKIARLFVRHVKRLAPKTVRVKVTEVSGRGKPWLMPTDHPALRAVARAVEQGFGKKPVYTRTGGTIPVVATFVKLLKAPCLLMGIGLPDENAHAPNEKLDLDNLHHGMLSAAYLFEELAETGKGKA
jgi:acetylornithine deacetylase/succinyl-diaminopimelate desuccinylase-like protein